MSAPEGRPDRAIAERLAAALERALGGAPARAPLEAARDAARVVGLEGLARLLATLVPYGGLRWPAPALAVCERVRSLARTARAVGSLDALRRAETEMERAAGRLGADAREAGEMQGGSLSLAEAVGPMRSADERLMALARDVRLTTPVAAALRAALDWLSGERMPVRFAVDDSALEIVLDRVNFSGLEAADRVLRDVGGNLGPALQGPTPDAQPRPWILRLPTLMPRPSFLMVVQGGLRLAIPWQAVLRLRMAPADVLAGRDRVLGLPVIASLAAPIAEAPQRPAIVMASGWKRACMIADRLVWRMIADPCDAGVAPTPGLAGAVRTDEGDIYWVVDPVALLAPVEPPATLEPPVPGAPPTPGRARSGDPQADAAPQAAPAGLEEPPLDELGPDDVEPLDVLDGDVTPAPPAPGTPDEPTTFEPAPSTAPPFEAPPAGPPAPRVTEPPQGNAPGPGRPAPTVSGPRPASPRRGPAPPRGRALVAEDSIAARIFLTRMLEREGFEVQAVASAADLFHALEGAWRLVFVDVELPDAYGPDLLRHVMDGVAGGVPVVALVRDADDLSTARAAGVTHALRKPFERDELERLLSGLGIVPERA